jgi:hypothetical protein
MMGMVVGVAASRGGELAVIDAWIRYLVALRGEIAGGGEDSPVRVPAGARQWMARGKPERQPRR